MDTNKITSRQVILLLVIFRLATVTSYMPVLNLPPANQDMWIIIFLSILYSTLFKVPLLFFANRFSDNTLIEYMEKIYGKFVGRFIGLLFGMYFIGYSVFLILNQTELIGAAILPLVPNWVTIGISTIGIIYIGSKGLLTIYWSGEIIAPINIVSIIFLILAGLNNVDFSILLPIMEDSIFYKVNLGAMILPLLFNEIFVLVMTVPHLEDKKDINKIFIKSVSYSLILVAIIVVVTQGALGIEQAKHSNFPFLIYTRLINFRATLERIDPIYAITWISANTIKIVTYIYLASVTFMEVLGMKDNKVILYIIAILGGSISLYISNRNIIIPLSDTLNKLLVSLAAIFITIIPTITLIIYFFRRKTLNREEKLEN